MMNTDDNSSSSSTNSAASSPPSTNVYTTIDRTILHRLESNPWDTAAWHSLFLLLDNETFSTALVWYHKALRIFPSNGYIVTLMGKRYVRENNHTGAEEVLQKYLLASYDPSLWLFYVTLVQQSKYEPVKQQLQQITGSSTNNEALTNLQQRLHSACSAVIQSYEFAIARMGYSYHSGSLWSQYIKFLNHEITTSVYYSKGQIMELRRKAYQRAIGLPHEAIDKLWIEYQKFEKENSPEKLAETLISQRQSEYGTATAVFKERSTLWKTIDIQWLPTPPPLDSELILTATTDPALKDSILTLRMYRDRLQEQLIHWRRIIGYELSNPLHCSKEILYIIVRLHFQQFISLAGKYAPEVWNDYANYEKDIATVTGTTSNVSSGGTSSNLSVADKAILKIYTDGISTMPVCASLSFIIADFHEIGGRTVEALEMYSNLLTELHKIADRTNGRKALETVVVTTDNTNSMEVDSTTTTPAALAAITTDLSSTVRYPVLDALDESSPSFGKLHSLHLLASAEDANHAAQTIPLIFILQQRAARRMEGIPAARNIFANARKSPYITPMVYFASAQLEYYTNRNIDATRNILEAGRKKYPANIDYLISCIDFLAYIDDSTNMKAFFENALKSSNVTGIDSRPLWDRYIQYELTMTQGGNTLASISNIEKARNRVHPYLDTPDIPLLLRNYHRYSSYGLVPSYRIDTDLLQRFPYQPNSIIQLTASSAAALAALNTTATTTTATSSTASTVVPLNTDTTIPNHTNIVEIGYRNQREQVPKLVYEGHYLQTINPYHNPLSYVPLASILSDPSVAPPSLVNEINGTVINKNILATTGSSSGGSTKISSSSSSSSSTVTNVFVPSNKYIDIPPFIKSLLASLPAYDPTISSNSTLPDVDTIISKLMHYNSHTSVLLTGSRSASSTGSNNTVIMNTDSGATTFGALGTKRRRDDE